MILSRYRLTWVQTLRYFLIFFLLVSGYDSYTTCPSDEGLKAAQSIMLAALGLFVNELKTLFGLFSSTVQSTIGFVILTLILGCQISLDAVKGATRAAISEKREITSCSFYLINFALVVRFYISVLWLTPAIKACLKACSLIKNTIKELCWMKKLWYALCSMLMTFGYASYEQCPTEDGSIAAQSIILVAGVLVIFEILKHHRIPERFKFYKGYGMMAIVALSAKHVYRTARATEESFCSHHLANMASVIHCATLVLLIRAQLALLPKMAKAGESQKEKADVKTEARKPTGKKVRKVQLESKDEQKGVAEESTIKQSIAAQLLKIVAVALVYFFTYYFKS